jgi:hypothetical protein
LSFKHLRRVSTSGPRASRPGPDGSRARQDKGFMSTQRRENRRQRSSCTEHAEGSRHIWLLFLAWFARAFAAVGTAPLPAILRLPEASFHPSDKIQSPGTPGWLATNSLQLGHRTTQPVRQEICRTSHSAPPLRAARRAIPGTPATRRSSLPLTPAPSGLVSVLSLPQNPAGKCRWTERHDGKRDLYFLNPA